MEPEQTLSKFPAICSDSERTFKVECESLIEKLQRVSVAVGGSSVQLPQDVVNRIVDNISSDRPTLFACTCLSRTWCTAALSHLLRTFTILDSAGIERANVLQKMGITGFVRNVWVVQEIIEAEALTHLNAFARIQELRLSKLDVWNLALRLSDRCHTLTSAVKTLALYHVNGSTKCIAYFVNLFSGLENLTVYRIDRDLGFDDSQVLVMPQERSQPLMGRLGLFTIHGQCLLRDLASMAKGVEFRTVDLCFCPQVQGVMDGCARTVERLILDGDTPQDDFKNLNFSRFEFLRHVEVYFEYIIRSFPDDPFYESVTFISSPQLETFLISKLLTSTDSSGIPELIRALQATPKLEGEKAGGRPKQSVKLTLRLEIMEERAEADHPSSVAAALDFAIANGGFDFLNRAPDLEVYRHVREYAGRAYTSLRGPLPDSIWKAIH